MPANPPLRTKYSLHSVQSTTSTKTLFVFTYLTIITIITRKIRNEVTKQIRPLQLTKLRKKLATGI